MEARQPVPGMAISKQHDCDPSPRIPKNTLELRRLGLLTQVALIAARQPVHAIFLGFARREDQFYPRARGDRFVATDHSAIPGVSQIEVRKAVSYTHLRAHE